MPKLPERQASRRLPSDILDGLAGDLSRVGSATGLGDILRRLARVNPAGSLPSLRKAPQPVDLTAEIAPGITSRLARPEDFERFSALISHTGTTVDDYLLDMLRSEVLSAAVLAGAQHGHDQFQLELAKCMSRFATLEPAALATALPLVAVTDADEIVGALLAYPPPNVIEQFVESRPLASKKDTTRMFAGAIMSLAKLRAVAVDPA
jgi:hypothetical protein